MAARNNPTFAADDLVSIDTPTFDPLPWVGKSATIGTIAIEYFRQDDNSEKPVLVVTTEPLDGTEMTVRRFYGLKKTDDGKVAWPTGGKLQDLLTEKKVSHPTLLIGKKVILTLTDPKGPEKKRYITF